MTVHTDATLQRILTRAWDAIAGPEIGPVTLATDFRDGELVVLVSSAAWVERLTPMIPDLVTRLNHALLAPDAVKSIRMARGLPEGATDAK
jgi:predicted nucleic acid-binding Zn ribbon protein